MTDLQDFSQTVAARLAAAQKEPNWQHDDWARYMAEFGSRQRRFEQLAEHLLESVIRPRLDVVAVPFNAQPIANRGPFHCAYGFGYSERFPVTLRVEFAIEFDARAEVVSVCYELHMMPVFIKYSAHDKMTLPLDEVSEENVAAWVERRLLEFLDTYLRIDRGEPTLDEDLVTDPVCGMRLRRSDAVAQEDHRGHPYYFCTEACRRQFSEEPQRFVRVVTQ